MKDLARRLLRLLTPLFLLAIPAAAAAHPGHGVPGPHVHGGDLDPGSYAALLVLGAAVFIGLGVAVYRHVVARRRGDVGR